MVKIKGPLFSENASGSVSPCLTFSKRKSGQQVRFQKKQKTITPSWGQTDNQCLYRLIHNRWLSFSVAEKAVYNAEAKVKNLTSSGWNLFFKKARLDPKTYLGLCGYWSFNRPNFGTVLDLSKNGNTATLKPLYPSNCPSYVESKNKKMGKALSFNGLQNYALVNNSASLRNFSACTLIMYIKIPPPQGISKTFLNFGYFNSPNYGFIVRKNSTQNAGDIYCKVTSGSAGTDTFDYSADTWTQIGFVWDGVHFWVVKNGVKQTQKNLVGLLNPLISLYIGCYNADNERMLGLFDEIKIYNRALSNSELLNEVKILN